MRVKDSKREKIKKNIVSMRIVRAKRESVVKTKQSKRARDTVVVAMWSDSSAKWIERVGERG